MSDEKLVFTPIISSWVAANFTAQPSQVVYDDYVTAWRYARELSTMTGCQHKVVQRRVPVEHLRNEWIDLRGEGAGIYQLTRKAHFWLEVPLDDHLVYIVERHLEGPKIVATRRRATAR